MRLINMAKGCESLIETVSGFGDLEIAGLTSDSRSVHPGYLFAALPGTVVDGRDYISQAQQNGAVCVLGPLGTRSEVPVIEDANPRLRFAKMAANFYVDQPHRIAAVTGTNGKTSVATFLRQILERLGYQAANMGTIGLFGAGFEEPGTLTTPDPVTLHATLKRLVDAGVDHLAMEASSHGLEQFRLDGVRIQAAAFTNVTRDHLDYHGTMDAYLAAKLRLFTEVVQDGGSAVVNADSPHAKDVIEVAQKRNLKIIDYGQNGDAIRLKTCVIQGHGQQLSVTVFGTDYDVLLPLAGGFQAENALCALGLALALGADQERAVKALEALHGVTGRMQCVGHVNGADVYVDYAHTPDALENVLKALRPHTKHKLHVVFGCGGDRDVGKRPEMGRVAMTFADRVIVTDDNPRTEDAASIRQQILIAAEGAEEIADRHQAIQHSVKTLGVGDVLVVAGKGHEQGQSVKGAVLPFDDVMEVKAAIRALGQGGAENVNMMKSKTPLWTSTAAAAATHGSVTRDFTATGISINTRTLKPGDLFVALVGPNADGHDYVAAAFEKGAVAACVSHRPPVFDPDTPLLMVEDTMQALVDLGVAGRAKFSGKMIAVTGSVGKTGTKDALKLVLGDQAITDASVGSLNNHWGLPLSLARLSGFEAYAIMELGMNHPGELRPLTKMTRPNVCLITTVQAAHTEFFDSTAQIADAKAEIFEGAEPGWTAVLNADIEDSPRLQATAQAQGAASILTFGERADADFRVVSFDLYASGSDVVADTPLGEVAYHIASAGYHWVINSLAVLACTHAVGADIVKAAKSLAKLTPPQKRGERFDVEIPGGTVTVIDESYNASPAAMRAALAVLAAQPTPADGRRIAVLGDMLELGDDTPKQHADLAEVLIASEIDIVYLAGPAMHHLWTALPASLQGHHCATSKDLAPVLNAAVQPGDVVMVKGSAGINMGHIVETLRSLQTSPRKGED